LGDARGRKNACLSGSNEKKERRKRSRCACTDKIGTVVGRQEEVLRVKFLHTSRRH
jgi:hypothetical protein